MHQTQDILTRVEEVALQVREHASEVDQKGAFPAASVEAIKKAGLPGLISSAEVGGQGEGFRAAAMVVERLARECGSTAMVLCMHYCGAAVIEKHGPKEVREAIARGEHLSTLAFSEAGSRSHFWAPVSEAKRSADDIVLNAKKSWVTSANHATAYVWSSKPVEGNEASTIWLVPRSSKGLRVPAPFDGLGLRGNDSAPVTAEDVVIPESNRLGADGAGFGIMMEVVLPLFSVLNASCSLGLMEAAIERTVAHVRGVGYEHLSSKLVDLPTIRSYIARMRLKADMARTLWLDTLSALEQGRKDAVLRVLECKAGAGETANEVLDIAMRVCGGAAFRKDVGVERYFRDARAAGVMAPTTDVLYEFLGKATCGLPLF